MPAVHVAKHNGMCADTGRRIEGVHGANCFEVCIHKYCLVVGRNLAKVQQFPKVEKYSGNVYNKKQLEELFQAIKATLLNLV